MNSPRVQYVPAAKVELWFKKRIAVEMRKRIDDKLTHVMQSTILTAQ